MKYCFTLLSVDSWYPLFAFYVWERTQFKSSTWWLKIQPPPPSVQIIVNKIILVTGLATTKLLTRLLAGRSRVGRSFYLQLLQKCNSSFSFPLYSIMHLPSFLTTPNLKKECKEACLLPSSPPSPPSMLPNVRDLAAALGWTDHAAWPTRSLCSHWAPLWPWTLIIQVSKSFKPLKQFVFLILARAHKDSDTLIHF